MVDKPIDDAADFSEVIPDETSPMNSLASKTLSLKSYGTNISYTPDKIVRKNTTDKFLRKDTPEVLITIDEHKYEPIHRQGSLPFLCFCSFRKFDNSSYPSSNPISISQSFRFNSCTRIASTAIGFSSFKRYGRSTCSSLF